MSIPRNLGNFADNVNANGKVEVTGINATGTPSASTALLGNGTWGTVATSPAGSNTQIQYNNSGAFGASSALTFDGTNFVLNNGFIRANNTLGYYTNLTATGLTNFATTMDFDSVGSYLFKIASSEQMRLTSTGLGIGTTNPTFKLDVQGPSQSNGDAVRNMVVNSTTSAGTNYGGGIAFGGYYNGTSSSVNDFASIQGFKENSTAGDYAGAIRFTTRANGGSPTERFRIGSSGQIGLSGANYGTSGQVLTSAGSGSAPTWSSPSAGALVYISTTIATGSSRLLNITTGFSSTYDNYLIIAENIKLGVNTSDQMSVRFYTGGTLRTSLYQFNRLTVNAAPSVGRSLNNSLIETGINILGESTISFTMFLQNANSTSARIQGQATYTCTDDFLIDGNNQNSVVFGYTGTSSTLTGIQFSMDSGSSTFASGTFKLYGIAKS